jgi:pimeloyl-ACP methyl ester carboxylesterase
VVITMERMQTHATGSGRPMALVGGGVTGWKSWEPHQALLAGSRRVTRLQPLAVQLGLENRPLPADYSIALEARALAAALDPEPVDLVAWSYGAFIALDFALGAPERVRTLTLIEPPAFWVLDATGAGDDRTRSESDDLRALYGEMTADVSEEQLARFLERAGLVPPGHRADGLPPWPSWLEHRRSLRTGDASWLHRDSVERLRTFDRPTLLVTGTGTTHVLRRIIDGLASTLPRAALLELPGGHAPQMVAMDAFLTRLREHAS